MAVNTKLSCSLPSRRQIPGEGYTQGYFTIAICEHLASFQNDLLSSVGVGDLSRLLADPLLRLG